MAEGWVGDEQLVKDPAKYMLATRGNLTKTRSKGMIGIATTIHAWTKGDRQACHC